MHDRFLKFVESFLTSNMWCRVFVEYDVDYFYFMKVYRSIVEKYVWNYKKIGCKTIVAYSGDWKVVRFLS